jgi:serine O-acetyltransferase
LTALADLHRADLAAAGLGSGRWALCRALLLEPGFLAVYLYRRAHQAQGRQRHKWARVLWRLNVALTSCHLSPKAEAGPGLVLPHAVGVVMGEGVRLGRGVTVYQHVTLGRSIRDGSYPTVGDGVVIYPQAMVIGGVHIGEAAVIGAGAVVHAHVPSGAVVRGASTQWQPEATS